jgi:hypothetical protein
MDDDGTSPFGSNDGRRDAAAETEWDTPEWRSEMIEKYESRAGLARNRCKISSSE